MFRFKNLLGLLVVVCLFASCEKNDVWEQQEVQSIGAIPLNNSQEAFMAVPSTMLPTIPIFHEILTYNGTCESYFGFCSNPFPFPPDDFPFEVTQQNNVGLSNVYIDGNNAFTFEVKANTLGNVFADELVNNSTFTVSNDVVLPTDLVNQVYENNGMVSPTENIVLPSGDYPVDVEEDELGQVIIVTVVIVTDEMVIILRIVYN